LVHLDTLLPERWRGLTRELASFGTIGVINLCVNFAVFNLLWLTILRTGELKAKAVATIVATTCAYFMNRHWTYRDRPKSTLRREYSLFFFFNLVGLIIEVAVVGLAKYGLHQTHIVALNAFTAIGILFGTIFRFWAYRTHVFRIEPVAAVVLATPTSVSGAARLATNGSPRSAARLATDEALAVDHRGTRSTLPMTTAIQIARSARAVVNGGSGNGVAAEGAIAGGGSGNGAAANGHAVEFDDIDLDGIVTLAERRARTSAH
jgi:putative flippase GtrA